MKSPARVKVGEPKISVHNRPLPPITARTWLHFLDGAVTGTLKSGVRSPESGDHDPVADVTTLPLTKAVTAETQPVGVTTAARAAALPIGVNRLNLCLFFMFIWLFGPATRAGLIVVAHQFHLTTLLEAWVRSQTGGLRPGYTERFPWIIDTNPEKWGCFHVYLAVYPGTGCRDWQGLRITAI